MKKILKLTLYFVFVAMLASLLFWQVPQVSAAISNPSIPSNIGNNLDGAKKGAVFVYYFILIWRVVIFVGGIMVLVIFIQAALEWIGANGETAKITTARNKITGAVMGMFILAASFVIVGFVGDLFGLSLLNPVIPTAAGGTPLTCDPAKRSGCVTLSRQWDEATCTCN